MMIVPALGRWRQEGQEFKAIHGYLAIKDRSNYNLELSFICRNHHFSYSVQNIRVGKDV